MYFVEECIYYIEEKKYILLVNHRSMFSSFVLKWPEGKKKTKYVYSVNRRSTF